MSKRKKTLRAINSHEQGVVENHVTFNAETCSVEVHTKCDNIYISEPFNARILPTLINIDPEDIKRSSRSSADLSENGRKSLRASCSLSQCEHSQYSVALI